jgi:hypothetical protein
MKANNIFGQIFLALFLNWLPLQSRARMRSRMAEAAWRAGGAGQSAGRRTQAGTGPSRVMPIPCNALGLRFVELANTNCRPQGLYRAWPAEDRGRDAGSGRASPPTSPVVWPGHPSQPQVRWTKIGFSLCHQSDLCNPFTAPGLPGATEEAAGGGRARSRPGGAAPGAPTRPGRNSRREVTIAAIAVGPNVSTAA